jgi:hypothetical protein
LLQLAGMNGKRGYVIIGDTQFYCKVNSGNVSRKQVSGGRKLFVDLVWKLCSGN